jgi:hypothetical protein
VYDPYAAIRVHIAAAREQFKPFKGFPCVLVLYAVHDSSPARSRDFHFAILITL